MPSEKEIHVVDENTRLRRNGKNLRENNQIHRGYLSVVRQQTSQEREDRQTEGSYPPDTEPAATAQD